MTISDEIVNEIADSLAGEFTGRHPAQQQPIINPAQAGFLLPGENMLYNTGTIAVNGNTATGTGTNWTAPASQVRAGQTIIVMSNPVQLFQISSVNSATSMTVTPAASRC